MNNRILFLAVKLILVMFTKLPALSEMYSSEIEELQTFYFGQDKYYKSLPAVAIDKEGKPVIEP